MGLFDFVKICLFSEVSGVVTLNGKPVAGVEVIRAAEFRSKRYVDKAIADNEGRYHFPESSEHSFSKITYLEPRISQSIVIRYHGAEYVRSVLMALTRQAYRVAYGALEAVHR